LVETRTAEDLVEVVRDADAGAEPVLLLAGGSNLLVGDDGWDGLVVLVRTAGVDVVDPGGRGGRGAGGVRLRVASGHPWDDLVAMAVDQGWAGVEALSGIPGSTGATPIQNVGAYGQEVAQTLVEVRVWDRVEGRSRTLSAAECGFAYRTSRLKAQARSGPRGTDRFVVLDVTFDLPTGGLGSPIGYAELARRLGVETGARVPVADVRTAVIGLRSGKGMVLDPADHDTWSAGSFFTNPVVDAETATRLPPGAPRWTAGDGRVKLAAAWLIEHSGIHRGYGLPGPAAVSTKHTLALSNRGSATAADVVALAREVHDAVVRTFGISLEPEPRLVGIDL
jgi:UDP-N-acetylmuramate dehydrogenase